MDTLIGKTLSHYHIVEKIGAGGMGDVYRARDTRLGRELAIKVLPADLTATPEARARLEREARAISHLNHPNICTLHDVGREGEWKNSLARTNEPAPPVTSGPPGVAPASRQRALALPPPRESRGRDAPAGT